MRLNKVELSSIRNIPSQKVLVPHCSGTFVCSWHIYVCLLTLEEFRIQGKEEDRKKAQGVCSLFHHRLRYNRFPKWKKAGIEQHKENRFLVCDIYIFYLDRTAFS